MSTETLLANPHSSHVWAKRCHKMETNIKHSSKFCKQSMQMKKGLGASCDAMEKLQGERTSPPSCNVFDDVRPYLLYIENIVFSLLGDLRDTFPHAWKQGSINEVAHWTVCGVFSVQEAVSLCLNYYRYLMEEFFAYCRRTNCTSRRDNKIALEIYKFINSVENAVWNDEKYELHMFSMNAQMENTNMPVAVTANADGDSFTVASEFPSWKADCANESSYQGGKNSTLVGNAVWSNKDMLQGGDSNAVISDENPVLLDCIDDEVEKRFLHEISTNGDAIFLADAKHEDVDFLLHDCTDNDFEPINVMEPTMLHSDHENKNNNVPKEVQCTSNVAYNMQSQFDTEQQQISLFHNMVQYKCKNLTTTLTSDQNEVLKRSIAHYSDLVIMHSMSATEASEHVEKVMHNILTDSNPRGYTG
jgi:hypothetical protein